MYVGRTGTLEVSLEFGKQKKLGNWELCLQVQYNTYNTTSRVKAAKDTVAGVERGCYF
jgi:hypothetical protein